MKIHLLKLFLNEFRKRKRKTSLITFAIAWGTLSLGPVQILYLLNGDGVTGGGLYVGEILGLEFGSPLVTNIYSPDGLNIYYHPHLAGNEYLGGMTFDLNGGGILAPVPIPGALCLLGSGLIALVGFRRKLRKI